MSGSLTKPDFLRYIPGEPINEQVDRVFKELMGILETHPNKKLGLLYSANNDQAISLHNARKNRNPIATIRGGGQARLFSGLIPKINDAVAKRTIEYGQIIVLPIATSLHGGNNSKGNKVNKVDIDRDLREVILSVQDGYDVLGCSTNENRFAIGGAISAEWFEGEFAELGNKSQGQYVDEILEEISSNPENCSQLLNNFIAENDYLSRLQQYRSQGLSGDWRILKDELVEEARKAIRNNEPVPKEIETALKEHYNPENSFIRKVSRFFHSDDLTSHWREVEQFKQEYSRNSSRLSHK